LGIDVWTIHGDLSQFERDKAVDGLRSVQLTNNCAAPSSQPRVLLATDVVARGLDIKTLQCVINYDLPDSLESYLHRCGRTGRKGQYLPASGRGIAFSLVLETDSWFARMIVGAVRRVDNIELCKRDLMGWGELVQLSKHSQSRQVKARRDRSELAAAPLSGLKPEQYNVQPMKRDRTGIGFSADAVSSLTDDERARFKKQK
jgi:superfamily II DNA/RNA helicase